LKTSRTTFSVSNDPMVKVDPNLGKEFGGELFPTEKFNKENELPKKYGPPKLP